MAIFAVAGVVSLGYIPGIGILLLCAASVIGFFGSAVSWKLSGVRNAWLWIGLGLSLLGILVVFTIDPISGLSILMGGAAVSIGAVVYQWVATVRNRRPPLA